MPRVRRSRRTRRMRYAPYKRRRRVTTTDDKLARYVGTMPKLSVNRGIYGFPADLVTKIRYCDVYQLTSTSASIAKNSFRLNSINDPDQTGVGHQPLYHDQLQALYDRYVVLGSKLTAQFAVVPSPIANAQPSGPITVGVLGDSNANTSSLLSTLLENNNGKSKLLPADQSVWLTMTYSPEKDLGVTENDDTVSAQFGSNPSEQWYATCFVCETNGGSTAVTVEVKVMIEYTIRCKKLLDLASS